MSTRRSNSVCVRCRFSSTAFRIATSALSARLGTLTLIRNTSTKRSRSLRLAAANASPAENVPQIAKQARMSDAIAVSRGPRRNAAHNSGRTARKPNASGCCDCLNKGLNATNPTATAKAMTAADWINSLRWNVRASLSAQRTTTGVTTSALIRSPSHQVSQILARLAHSASPAIAKPVVATVALVGVATAAQMTANFATVLGVENVSRPLHQTLIKAAPISASSELPVAIATAVPIELAAAALAVIAARNIAGQTRYPHSTIAARANPVGGQTDEALGWIKARARPPLARTK